jgi:squalene synthase HpnC
MRHGQSTAVSVGHYENFPVASILCPRGLRAPIRAIYAFARTADDLADEGDSSAQQRLTELARYRQALRRAARGEASMDDSWPKVFDELAAQIQAHRLPLHWLEALLDAFERDARNPRYRTRAELLDYCRLSANPIGRLLLHLYRVDDAHAVAQSDAVCTALQLINFWQDLSVDLSRGRIYVPDSDAVAHGVDDQMLLARRDCPQTRALVRDLVRWANDCLARGTSLATRLPGRAGWELAVVVQGGWRVLEKIAVMEFATIAAARRPRLTARDLPVLLWRAFGASAQPIKPGRFA